MGRGLSIQQKQILEYLKARHAEGIEVVPLPWMLIDLYGVKGEKGWDKQHVLLHIHPSKGNEKYKTKMISMCNSLKALRMRNLVWKSCGYVGIEKVKSSWTGVYEYKRKAEGYCLANTPGMEPDRLYGWGDKFDVWAKEHSEIADSYK